MLGSTDGGRVWSDVAEDGGGEDERAGVVVGVTFDATRQYSSKLSVGIGKQSPKGRQFCKTKTPDGGKFCGDGGRRCTRRRRRRDARSLIPSHSASCSAFLSPVIRFVFPHRMKSASFIWPMNACLHASGLGESNSLSVGGDTRCRSSLNGAPDWDDDGALRAEDVIVWLSYMSPMGQCLWF